MFVISLFLTIVSCLMIYVAIYNSNASMIKGIICLLLGVLLTVFSIGGLISESKKYLARKSPYELD